MAIVDNGPWIIERVLNYVNYVIRRVSRRDRRIVHVDRLQRYVEAIPNDVVLASQPRPNCTDSLCRLRPGVSDLANQPSLTMIAIELRRRS